MANAAGTVRPVNNTSVIVNRRVIPKGPVFDVYPVGMNVVAGQPARISASVSGTAPLQFRWLRSKDPASPPEEVPGATSAEIVFAAVTPGDGGYYTLEASNAVGTVASPPVELQVLPADPPVTWDPPATVAADVPLGPEFFVASSPVPGRFVFDPALGARLPEGSHVLRSTFEPSDPSYRPVTIQRPVNAVRQASITATLSDGSGVVVLSWESDGSSWVLQASRDAGGPWVAVTNGILSVGTQRVLVRTPRPGGELFRLVR